MTGNTVRAAEAAYRKKRVKRIKRIIVGTAIVLLLLPTIMCLFLLVKVHSLEKQIETITKVSNSDVVKAQEKEVKTTKEPKKASTAEPTIKPTDDTTTKKVYLTFDDGPGPYTEKLLDILDRYNVKATFFVLGSNAERYPEIVKRAYQEGHYIANHSFTHVYSNIYSSPQAVLDEYNRTEIAIKNAIGDQTYNSRVFRFPGGTSGGKYANIKAEAVNLLNQNNVAHLDWNALTADAAGLDNVNDMMNYVETTMGNKNSVVILMHDIGTKKSTYELLPQLIQALKEKGYVFENIYDILKS